MGSSGFASCTLYILPYNLFPSMMMINDPTTTPTIRMRRMRYRWCNKNNHKTPAVVVVVATLTACCFFLTATISSSLSSSSSSQAQPQTSCVAAATAWVRSSTSYRNNNPLPALVVERIGRGGGGGEAPPPHSNNHHPGYPRPRHHTIPRAEPIPNNDLLYDDDDDDDDDGEARSNQMSLSPDEIQPARGQHPSRYQQQQQEQHQQPPSPYNPYQSSYYNDNNHIAEAEDDYFNNYNYNEENTNFAPPPNNNIEDPFPPETVQQQVERWKTQQREQAVLTSQDIPNRGQEGAVSLVATVSKGARCMVFMIQMWRNLHLFETADQVFSSKKTSNALRSLLVTPMVFLFVANLGGAMASLSSTTTAAKKRRLKAILNVDKMVELILICYYAIRLTIAPSRYTSREVYISNIFHSVLFFLQCNSFTRVSWNDSAQPPEFQRPSTTEPLERPDEAVDSELQLEYEASQPYNPNSWQQQQPPLPQQQPTPSYGAYSRNSQYDNGGNDRPWR